MDETVNSVVLLVGLAVGVDYSLFYLRREREERAAGRSDRTPRCAAAAATSGHAVLVSGLTVMIAMAGHVPRRQRDLHRAGHRLDHRRRASRCSPR